MSRRWARTSLWEAVAHEFGHTLDHINYGGSYNNVMTHDGREMSAINRVNRLRVKVGRPIQFYP